MAARKVLAVDDSAADLTNIKNVLTEAGCMVVTASKARRPSTAPSPTSRT